MQATSQRQTWPSVASRSAVSPSAASSWSDLSQQVEQHRGPVLMAAAAVALLLIVSFIGVLQSQVQRGELLREQQRMASTSPNSMNGRNALTARNAAKATALVVARNGR